MKGEERNGMKERIYAFADEASSEINGQIKAMLRNRLDGLEIRNVDGINIADITCDKAREVKSALDAEGLVVWSVGSPIGKINVYDDFVPHLDKFKHTLELSNILGSENMRIFSFYIPEGVAHKDCQNEVLDRLGKMAEIAKSFGVILCHENEKGIFGDTPERCKILLDNIDGLFGIFDPANFVQCGVDTLAAWEMLSDRIRYMHIKDSKRDGTIVPAGKGDGNVREIVSRFVENGGRDFTMEPHLTVFEGLATLEREGEQSNVTNAFADADTAFDIACMVFRELF